MYDWRYLQYKGEVGISSVKLISTFINNDNNTMQKTSVAIRESSGILGCASSHSNSLSLEY